LVLKAIEAAVPETSSPQQPGARETTTWSQKRADALAVIFESFLAHGAEAMSGGERHQVVVHVSAEMLRGSRGPSHHPGSRRRRDSLRAAEW
jgi:hypothetical protein